MTEKCNNRRLKIVRLISNACVGLCSTEMQLRSRAFAGNTVQHIQSQRIEATTAPAVCGLRSDRRANADDGSVSESGNSLRWPRQNHHCPCECSGVTMTITKERKRDEMTSIEKSRRSEATKPRKELRKLEPSTSRFYLEKQWNYVLGINTERNQGKMVGLQTAPLTCVDLTSRHKMTIFLSPFQSPE